MIIDGVATERKKYRCTRCYFSLKTLPKHIDKIQTSHQKAYRKDDSHILKEIVNDNSE